MQQQNTSPLNPVINDDTSIDQSVVASQSRTPTANSIVTVRGYFEQPVLARKDDPLKCWSDNQLSYQALLPHVRKYLAIPASFVPSEQLFSKAGELTSLKRSRIKSKNVYMILFLNKAV